MSWTCLYQINKAALNQYASNGEGLSILSERLSKSVFLFKIFEI